MERSAISEPSQWYVQKGSRVQGPFTCEEVGRFLLLGRVRNTDRVSRDGELWEPVTQVPELVPEALLDLESGVGWRRFVEARSAQDERRERPGEPVFDSGDAPREERRDPDADPLQRIRKDWLAARASAEPVRPVRRWQTVWLPWTLLGITLAALLIVLWLNASASPGG